MNGRQLLAILLCGMFLAPAPGVMAADDPSTEPYAVQENGASPADSSEEGVYVPQGGDSKVPGMEYAGLAVVDSDGTVLDKSTIEPGERLRVEVTSSGSGTDYHLLVDGVDEPLDTTSETTNGRFGYEVLVFEVSYAELNKHREKFSNGLTIYTGTKLTPAVDDWWEATHRVDHFELGDDESPSDERTGEGTTERGESDGGIDVGGGSPLDGAISDNPVGGIIDTLWSGNPFTSSHDSTRESSQENDAERGTDGGSIVDVFDLPEVPFSLDSDSDTNEPQPTDEELLNADENELTVDVRPQDTPVNVGDDVVIEAEITNQGNETVTDEAHLLVGLATHLDKQAITLEPGESETVRFEQDLPTLSENHTLTFTVRTVNGGVDRAEVLVRGDAAAARNSDENIDGTYVDPPLYLEGSPEFTPADPGDTFTTGTMAVETRPDVSSFEEARLYIDGRLVDTRGLEIPAQGQARLDLNYTIPEDRERDLSIRVEVGDEISREYTREIRTFDSPDTGSDSGTDESPSDSSLPHNPVNAGVEVHTVNSPQQPSAPGEPMRVSPVLRANTSEPIQQDVRLYVDGKYIETKTVTIPGREMASVSFEHDLPEYEHDQDIPYKIEAGMATATGLYEVRGTGDPSDAFRTTPQTPNLNLSLYTDEESLQEVPAGEGITVEANIENNDDEPVTDVVRLLLDGEGPKENQEISTRKVSLDPGERKIVGFWYEPFSYNTGQELPLQIEAGGDAIRITPYFHESTDSGSSDGTPSSPNQDSARTPDPQLDRPNITVNIVRPDVLRDNRYEVEFTAENPNERSITVNGEFTSGTTNDVPPQTLEPGENTFRATWTPESDDEQLAYEGHLDGYDEPITATTDAASEYASDSRDNETESGSGSGTELRGAQEARFDGCKYVEVDGEFGEDHTIIPTITWYSELGDSPQAHGEYGILGENIEETPFNGTIIFQIVGPDEAPDNAAEESGIIMNETEDVITYTIVEGNRSHGLGILGISSGTEPEDTMYGSEYTFQNPNDCFEATQPARPSASLDGVEATGDGTYDVTVTVENPNDANMTLRGGFVGSVADADVENDDPYMLEPGENTYTATWAPDSSNERLRFTGDLSGYDYDDPLTIETDPASDYGFNAPDEGNPSPRVVSVDADPIERGALLNLTVEVVNDGDGPLDDEVRLFRQETSEFIEEQPLELEPGERGTVELSFGTETMNLNEQVLYQVRVGNYSAQSSHPSVETFDPRQWISEGSGATHPSTIVQPGGVDSNNTADTDTDESSADENATGANTDNASVTGGQSEQPTNSQSGSGGQADPTTAEESAEPPTPAGDEGPSPTADNETEESAGTANTTTGVADGNETASTPAESSNQNELNTTASGSG